MTGGGLGGLVRQRAHNEIIGKRLFASSPTRLAWYFAVMRRDGLGIIDEHVDYLIQSIEHSPAHIDQLLDVEMNGDTLLHVLCRRSYVAEECFSHKLFSYLIDKGVDMTQRNDDGVTCVDLLQCWV